MGELERKAYAFILHTFPRRGRRPTLSEIVIELESDEQSVANALQALHTNGALRLERDTNSILDAYPYSGVPTAHRVFLAAGVQVYCMCAIDVFYVPFLTGSDITVRSSCFHCGADLELAIRRQEISRTRPETTVIWNSKAPYDCPKTNFFCSEPHLAEWRRGAPAEPGSVCTLSEALERGRIAANRIRSTIEG